jgi:hypothetical protein
MKLFEEQFWTPLIIREALDEATHETRMRVIGVVQQADTTNNNRRLYPKDVLDEAVENLMPGIKAGQVFGEIDHPQVKGKLKDTSHVIKDLWWNAKSPNQLMGELLILNTPSGQILREVIRAGGRPGLSSRGTGKSAKATVAGIGEVDRIEKGFRFESFDFVIDPSVSNARIVKIMEQAELREKLDGALEEELKQRLRRLAGMQPVKAPDKISEEEDFRRRLKMKAGITK